MAKSREQKIVALEQLTQGFKDAKSVAFADYRGLSVPQADELRGKMRDANVRYIVAKKTLVSRAAKDAGVELNAKQYEGMIGVAFGIEDEIAPAKILGDLSKTTSVQIVGGLFEGAVVPKEKMIELSKLPSKLELLGTLVGTFYAPVSSFVRVLNAIREDREAAEGTPAASEEAPKTEEVTPAAESAAEEPSSAESSSADASGDMATEDSAPKAEEAAPEASDETPKPEPAIEAESKA